MPKMNFILAKGSSFYCEGIFSIGVYIKNQQAILIDSGISKDVAKELNKSLKEAGVQVAAIINTHCHGDHSGGNAFFQQNVPHLRIYSTATEKPFIEDPLMAPCCFCAGAAAFEDLKKCKPIAPQEPCTVTDVIAPYEDQTLTLLGETFEILTLPGHTRGMIAVRSPDNVLYCGDALFGQETFKKHPILYYTFIQETLHSFQKLRSLVASAALTLLYHGGLVSDLSALIDAHEKRILETKEQVFALIAEQPLSLEELTAKLMQLHHIPDSVVAFALTKTPMQAYLAQLESEKRVQIRVTQGMARAHSLVH